jgi:hypothetical protein
VTGADTRRAQRDGAAAPGLKITTQYRSKLTMIYELESRGLAFEILISRAGSDSEPGEWHVEAHNGVGDGAVAVAADGATASDALSVVARSWRATGTAGGLPELDWEAVATLLRTVRAI